MKRTNIDTHIDKAVLPSSKVEGVSLITDRNHLFTPGNVPTAKVSRAGASGTPDEFDRRFDQDRKRQLGQRSATAPRPKLTPIENVNMAERLAQLGVDEVK